MSIGHETPPSEARIDLAEIENMRQWTNKYKVGMFWDLIAELKRLYKLEKIVMDIEELFDFAEHECHLCDEAGGLASTCEYDYRCGLMDHFTCVCGECGYRHDRFEPCKYCASE